MGGNSDPFRHEVKHKEQANCFDYTMGIQTDLILEDKLCITVGTDERSSAAG
jgi:hypothetical protein